MHGRLADLDAEVRAQPRLLLRADLARGCPRRHPWPSERCSGSNSTSKYAASLLEPSSFGTVTLGDQRVLEVEARLRLVVEVAGRERAVLRSRSPCRTTA